ncbi:MAG: ABC transporter substrate-binding protein [Bacilli bacterium]|nr:ABC transporter substrate-binding protein [Bacilli bacterium]
MNFLGSSFFSFDFKFDNEGEIIDGKFDIEYAAATLLEDVSADYEGLEWGIEEDAKGRAYKITLRQDLTWDDGTPIKAEDFVYTMQQQLDPLFQNYRADSFYVGATIIHNAENYAKQGQKIFVDNASTGDQKYTVADLVLDGGVYELPNGMAVKFSLLDPLAWCGGDTVTDYRAYLDATAFAALQALADENGRVDVTDETIALVTTLIDTDNWGHEPASNVPYYMVYENEYAAMDFEDVGILAESDYELVIILDKSLDLLDDEGNLTYKAAYNMASLPLVKESLYEANKVAPASGSTLWTSTYNNSVSNSASWGPYKLSKFQAGKEYELVRNDNWFGFTANLYPNQYQTDTIYCETLSEWQSAWLKFKAGEIDNIGIDVSIATDYKSSERAYYTPDDFVASLQLQSDVAALKARETTGYNKSMLAYTDFRKALSLGINRAEFAAQTTTSSLAGFGLFNSMHYYDVANGGVYRNEDVARQVLCDVYNVDATQFDSLELAEKSITGYDLTAARALVTSAYNAALAAGDISATDKVKLTLGTGTLTEAVIRRFDYLEDAWTELVVGTPLEGRMEFEQIAKGSTWANDFRSGAYDVCMGGWTGAAWDPGYFLLAYLSPSYMYSRAWATDEVTMEFTMVGGGEGGVDVTDTLSLLDWYDCLNGATGAKYDFGAGVLEEAKRLTLIAALEKEILKVYYTVPLYNNYGASLLSYKIEFKTYTYNTFMAYGGIRYITYNYTDNGWAKVIADNNGDINYKG